MKGRVIRFRGGQHREVQDLLPWYVTGKLEPAEREAVEAHLNVCAECREELAFQRELDTEIARLPIEVEQSWVRMRQRITAPEARSFGGGAMALASNWRTTAPWLLTALVIVTAAWLLILGQPGRYHALGSAPPPAAAGNVAVIFRPDTPEAQLRAALRATHGRLVDGPTAADAYILAVPAAQREAALAGLRGRRDIVMAEPIDPAP